MYVYVYHPCLNEIIRRQVRASFRGDGAVFVFPMYDTGPDICHVWVTPEPSFPSSAETSVHDIYCVQVAYRNSAECYKSAWFSCFAIGTVNVMPGLSPRGTFAWTTWPPSSLTVTLCPGWAPSGTAISTKPSSATRGMPVAASIFSLAFAATVAVFAVFFFVVS